MQLLIPHLWYNTEANQATSLYTQLLPDSGIDWIHTVTDTPSGDAELIQFHLGDTTLAAISAGPYYYSQRRDGLSRTGMLEDISGMITNAEARLALLVAMGYDVQAQIASYKARLKKCQADALYDGQIELYHSLTAKLNLIEYHGKGEWRWT